MTATATPAPPASRGSRLLWPVALIGSVVLGIGGGVVGSLYVAPALIRSPKAEAPDKQEKTKEAEPHEHASPSPTPEHLDHPTVPLAEELRRIDEQIQEGRYAVALEAVGRLAPPNEQLPRPARYRAALCLEALDRPTEAIPHYRACALERSAHLVAASQFGLARAMLRGGQADEGRALLCALLLRCSDTVLDAWPYQTDCECLLGLSLSEKILGNTTPSATSEALAGASLAAWPVERYVPWCDPPRPLERKAGKPRPISEGIGVTKKGEPPTYLVSAMAPAAELVAALEMLASQGGLELRWAAGSREAVAGRIAALECRDVPLANLLDWLTIPHDVTWSLADSVLELRSGGDRAGRALRCLRATLADSSSHPRIGDVYLSLGNLEAQAGRHAQALFWYQRLASDLPRSPALVSAFYNAGQLRLRDGELPAARAAFFRAIDSMPGSELTGLCYWWLGRAHLDERDAAGALRQLSRARQVPATDSGPSPTATASVVALACLSLLQDQPAAAWELLRTNRNAVRRPPFAAAAAFLDAYARHRMVADDPIKSRATTTELIALLAKPRDEPWLGPAYAYLQGQALRQVGLGQEMVALYDRAVRTTGGSLADEMKLQAADAFLADGQTKEARSRLEPLAKSKSRWAAQAKLRLAEVDLREGQPQACVERCRKLLAGKEASARAVLPVMGRGYAALRDFSRASQCFAGKVPEAP